MPTVLPPTPLLSAFLLASLILAMTPGPAVFYILTRSVVQGRASGLASAAGVALGSVCNALAAELGLAALFALSALAFTVVKYAGAAYLMLLGVKALLAAGSVPKPATNFASSALHHIFRDAFTIALFNPTTTLFFALFLPQFLTPAQAAHAPALHALALGGIFVLIAACTDVLYALAAGSVHPWFMRHGGLGRTGKITEGCVYIALGLFAALGPQHFNG